MIEPGPGIRDELQKAIDAILSDHAEIATNWVAAVEGIDGTGQKFVYIAARDGMNAWDTLGLLDYAMLMEKTHVAIDIQKDHGDQ